MSTYGGSVLASLINELPDALINVVQYLSTSDRRRLAAVCRETREICNGMEKSICLASYSFLSAQPIIFVRFPALAHLKCVDGGIDDEQLSLITGLHLTKGFGRLKSLSITQCSYMSTCVVTALLVRARKLEHLALGCWACTASILGFPASLCTSLRTLDCGDDQVDVESVDDTSLRVLSGLCTSLQKLSLSRCVTITDAGSLSAMCSLTELRIAGCKGISQLPSLPALQLLDASHCCSLGNSALEGLALGGAPRLKCLMLERCAITNGGLAVCCQMPHLERLDLGPSFEVNSAGLASLGRCHALQSLCLGNLVIQQEVHGMGPGTICNGSCTITTTTNDSTATNSSTNHSTTTAASLTTNREGCSHNRSRPADVGVYINAQRGCRACGCQHQGPSEHGSGEGPSEHGSEEGCEHGSEEGCCSLCLHRACSRPGRGTEAGTPHDGLCSCLQACSPTGRGADAGTPHADPCSCPARAACSGQAVQGPSNSAPSSQGPTMFTSLKRLQFGGSFFTCGLHLVFPVAPIASLTSLRVNGCSTVVGPHMVSIARQTGIEHLELHGGYSLSPEDCLPLVRGLPRLRKLVFACCPLISSKAASHLLSVSSSLAVIELWRSGGAEGSGEEGTGQAHGCRGEYVQEIRRS